MNVLRSVWWTLRALHTTRRGLRESGVQLVPPPDPPEAVRERPRAVQLVLGRSRATCLERSIVEQAMHGREAHAPDVVIGVAGSPDGPLFHAWLDDADPLESEGFAELTRIPRR